MHIWNAHVTRIENSVTKPDQILNTNADFFTKKSRFNRGKTRINRAMTQQSRKTRKRKTYHKINKKNENYKIKFFGIPGTRQVIQISE